MIVNRAGAGAVTVTLDGCREITGASTVFAHANKMQSRAGRTAEEGYLLLRRAAKKNRRAFRRLDNLSRIAGPPERSKRASRPKVPLVGTGKGGSGWAMKGAVWL